MGANLDLSETHLGARVYNEHTPIEVYSVQGRHIYVKRDDLFSLPPAPPLAKLRGMRTVLASYVHGGQKIIGCFQTRISNIGHALAAACEEFPAVKAIVVYPQSSKQPVPDSILKAQLLGAEILPIKSNVLPICYVQSKRIVQARGGILLPFGMDCLESVQAVAGEAANTPSDLCRGATLIVPCGSGITLAGILLGLPFTPKRIIAVSSGRSIKLIQNCTNKYVSLSGKNIEFIAPSMSYYEFPSIECPFPAHPHYDLKAWQYLVDHIATLSDPILFWNIGG